MMQGTQAPINSEIPNRIEKLNSSVSALHEIVDTLYKRLDSVMSPDTPDKLDVGVASTTQEDNRLSQRISTITNGIESAQSRLYQILNRLEV